MNAGKEYSPTDSVLQALKEKVIEIKKREEKAKEPKNIYEKWDSIKNNYRIMTTSRLELCRNGITNIEGCPSETVQEIAELYEAIISMEWGEKTAVNAKEYYLQRNNKLKKRQEKNNQIIANMMTECITFFNKLHDLKELTDLQRKQYYLALTVCQNPPEMIKD